MSNEGILGRCLHNAKPEIYEQQTFRIGLVISRYLYNQYQGWRLGLEPMRSKLGGVWSGEFVRLERNCHWPELFLYSDRDLYMPAERLEQLVLPGRDRERHVRTKKFGKSRHVSHYPTYREEYEETVFQFVEDVLSGKIR